MLRLAESPEPVHGVGQLSTHGSSSVSCGNPRSPLHQLFRTIVAVDGAFDQRRSGLMRDCLLNGRGQPLSRGSSNPSSITISGVECGHDPRIVPVLYVVVWPVVNFHLDGVSAIVNE